MSCQGRKTEPPQRADDDATAASDEAAVQIADKPVFAEKASQSLPPQQQKYSKHVISGDMCVGNDTAYAGSG
jgi:hypothetical protein